MSCDTSRAMHADYPELGPVYWRGTKTGGLRAKPRKPAPWKIKALDDYYPVFSLGGHPYSAMRWLYFQLYDDRHKFSYDWLQTGWLDQRKPAFLINEKVKLDKPYVGPKSKVIRYERDELGGIKRKLTDLEWMYNVEDMPNSLRPFFNCSHQEWIAIYWYSHGAETIRRDGSPPSGVWESVAYREWNEMFWFDKKNYSKAMLPKKWLENSMEGLCRSVPQHSDRVRNQLPWTWDKDTKQFQRVQLVFPEYVGPDRINLVRHYLLGGTDADRPAPGPTKVSADWIDWCKTMNWRYEEDTY